MDKANSNITTSGNVKSQAKTTIWLILLMCIFFFFLWKTLSFPPPLPVPAPEIPVTSDLPSAVEQLRGEIEAVRTEQQENSNHIWTMIAAGLVFFMQCGFLFLESGLVRAKNTINVAQKNILDFVMASCFFYAFGFVFMFGPSIGGLIGWDTTQFLWGQIDDWNYTFFVFQLVFCATAATIISGAVAERMKFQTYLVISIFVSFLIYPVFGHWAWGNLLNPENEPFLASRGFIDFAGSTVVHSVGGWVALAAIMVLGPRLDKFNEDGTPNTIPGHNVVLASAGLFILWLGWIGFNGGSTTVGSPEFAHIIVNTMLSAAFAGLVAFIIGGYLDKIHHPSRLANGVLGGLVAITAGCDAVSTHGAIVIGLSAGIVVVFAEKFIEEKLKLDDVIGAVAVHGVCGAWGTILAGVLAMPDKLGTATRMEQVIVQLEGVGLCFVWAFGVSYVFFRILNATMGMRVSAEDELRGLNETEHGATMGVLGVLLKLQEIAEGKAKFMKKLEVDKHTEEGDLANVANKLMDKQNQLSSSIFDVAKNIDSATTSIAAQATELAAGAEQQQQQARQVSSSVKEMATTVDEMASAATRASQLGRSTKETAKKGGSTIAGTMESIDAIIGKVSNLSEAMDEQSKSSEAIGEVTGVILDIVRKLEILSVNAMIKAEEVGEEGKGFSVVASEMANMAADTKSAAKEITQLLTRIQKQSVTSSVALKEVETEVSRGDKMASEGSQALTEIIYAVESTTTEINDIAAGVKEQAANATGVSQNLDAILSVNNETLISVSSTAEDVRALKLQTNKLSKLLKSKEEDEEPPKMAAG